MSEKFAQTLIANLDRRIRFARHNHQFDTEDALRQFREAIIETMVELGYDRKKFG